MNTSKGTEKINEEGTVETEVETKVEKINEEGIVETKVETVDYQWPAGRSAEEEPNKGKVEVVHLSRPSDDTGGVLADAAAAVATKVQSAKDAISGIGSNNNK